MTLEKVVAAKLAAQRGNEDAAALWKEIWSAYERGGAEGARVLLDGLLEISGETRAEDEP
ncbi:MAG TPA: hypothetical protein VFP65_20400 [Anaeromyxobacteraceae bacterium]|nr:hypothetical protein [Anaeromyxobacteraceae bacterium]